MKAVRDPARMTELGGGAAPELAAALRALRAGHGSAAQVQALATKLGPQLSAPTLAGNALLPVWAKWLLGGLLSCALGVYLANRAFRVEPQPAPRATAALRAPQAPVATPKPASERALAVELPAAARAAATPRHPRHAAPRRPRPTAQDHTPEHELALLQRTQSALDRAPELALALSEEHARDYPQGLFAQEREVLAIEALLKLRRRPAALARAQAFVDRFPDSPHARRVRALLDRSRSRVPETTAPAASDSSAQPESGGEHEAK